MPANHSLGTTPCWRQADRRRTSVATPTARDAVTRWFVPTALMPAPSAAPPRPSPYPPTTLKGTRPGEFILAGAKAFLRLVDTVLMLKLGLNYEKGYITQHATRLQVCPIPARTPPLTGGFLTSKYLRLEPCDTCTSTLFTGVHRTASNWSSQRQWRITYRRHTGRAWL